MSKVNLVDLVNLQNETTAVTVVNGNSSTIETAFDNTLSRDGTSPNQMGASLDMNSNRIINLPTPVSNFEPLRVIDRTTLNGGGSISVSGLPTGGTAGQALTKNSATNFDVGWSTVSGGGITGSNEIDVFLVAGQSNAQGNSNDSVNSPSVPTGKVLQYYNGGPYNNVSAGTITDALDPVGPAIGGSAWPAFGLTYYSITGRKICFVPAAVGGTDQSSLTLVSSLNWDASGTLYGISVTRMDNAISGLQAAGYSPRNCGVLWCQGENDAGGIQIGNITKADYKSALQAMIARYRSHFGATMPFYIFTTGALFSGTNTYYDQIRAAQYEVASADYYTRILFDNAALIGQGMMQSSVGNTLHYTQAGYNMMGRQGASNLIGGGRDLWRAKGTTTTGYSPGAYITDNKGTVNLASDTVAIEGPSTAGYLFGIHTTESGAGILARLSNHQLNASGGGSCAIYFQPSYADFGELYGSFVRSTWSGTGNQHILNLGNVNAGSFTTGIQVLYDGTVQSLGALNVLGIPTFMYNTTIPAGGTAGTGIKMSATGNFGIFFGSGVPTLSAAKGSIYLRSDGSSTSTRMYVNTDGSTTWTNFTTAA